jgi:hypothetical protein
MKRASALTSLFVVFAVPYFWAQMRETSALTWNRLGTDKAQAAKALSESGSLVQSDAKTEFFIVPKKSGGEAQSSASWDFGSKELKAHESLSVDVQVGEYLGKPVYLAMRVPFERGQAEIDDATEVLFKAFSENGQLYDKFKLQKCADGRKCVKSCKDEKGRFYCCRYECVRK